MTAFFPCLGNHEFFDVQLPYYSFDWANAHTVVLNPDLGNVSRSLVSRAVYWKEELRWLDEDLSRSRQADFVFVALHHPPLTAVKRRRAKTRK